MIRTPGLYLALAAALVMLPGCPTAVEQDSYNPAGQSIPTFGTSGNSSGLGGGSQTGTAGVSALQPSLADGLTARFSGCTEPLEAASWRAEILRLVNLERARNGLRTLTMNQTLEDQANEYACELIFYDFFAHENPITGSTLRDRAEDFGYDYQVIGENLAAGQRTPLEAFNDWMDSEGHRRNILDERFEEIGIGIRSGGDYGLYWVQEFGRPAR